MIALFLLLAAAQDVPLSYDCEQSANPMTGTRCDRMLCDCTECVNASDPSIVWCAPYLSLNTSHLPVGTNWTCVPPPQKELEACQQTRSTTGLVVTILFITACVCSCCAWIVSSARNKGYLPV